MIGIPKGYIMLLAILLGWNSWASADETQPNVKLSELIRAVVQENPELKFYDAEAAAAKGEVRASGAWSNPELDASLGRKESFAEDSGFKGDGTAWSVSITQTFDYPGRIGLRKAIAGRQLRLAELGLERFKAALAGRARLLGLELLGKQEAAKAARQVTARTQEVMSVLVQRDPSGIAPLLEMRIIQAGLIRLRKEAIETEKEAQSALFALNQLRGADLSAPIVIAPADIRLPVLPGVEELVAAAAKGNLDLQTQRVELENQGFKVSLSKNERWPSIKAGPFYSEESAGERETTVGINLSLPLPVWDQNQGSIDVARAREQQARASLALSQRRIEQDVRERALSYKLLLAEMARWSPRITEELREAAALGDKHYRLGAIPVATYLELQERYPQALKDIYQAKAEALSTVQELELLTGQTYLQTVEAGEFPTEQKR